MPSRKKNQTKTSTGGDPNASLEADKYVNPIASRKHILVQMEAIGEPASLEQLASHLDVTGEKQTEALRRRLTAMKRDGQIISNRRGVYCLADHMELIKGTVQGTRDGAGYFVPDSNNGDMFLPLREMARLFDGDRVLARRSGIGSRGRPVATVVEILEHRYTEIVGRFFLEAEFAVLVADNKRIQHEIIIPLKKSAGASEGQYVLARIVQYPERHRKPVAEVVEVLGDVSTPGIEIEVALHSFALPHIFPAAAKKETSCLSDVVNKKDRTGRFDLRKIPFVTIDGEDAKDFDDAVFVKATEDGGWTLLVAIADVSHYVAVNSALDKEAAKRGTSVYFPGHVIPMLPEKISNGLCSLMPNCNRLAMVCELNITPQGHLHKFQFFEAVIHSHARLTYTEVADMLEVPVSGTRNKIRARLRQRYSDVVANLDECYALYHALRQARFEGGALDFDSTETRMVFDKDRKIREIVPVERNDAHRLIEECMLIANVAAASLLQDSKLPALYRVHAGPNPERLADLREFLSEMGLSLGGGKQPAPKDYQATLLQIADRPDRHLLQTVMIKSMQQAVYQSDNTGHFGLGFESYTHFTSPIRRYPDLIVHRAIRYLIRAGKKSGVKPHPHQSTLDRNNIYPYSLVDLDKCGLSCSTQERRADAASYNVMDWLKCEYMQDKVGEEFSGTIVSVTSFGLFVELDGIYIEGLVHISELLNDYYLFNAVHHCLKGENSGRVYRLGDAVTVRLARVNLEEKKIDLQIDTKRSPQVSSRGGMMHQTRADGGKGSQRSKSGLADKSKDTKTRRSEEVQQKARQKKKQTRNKFPTSPKAKTGRGRKRSMH